MRRLTSSLLREFGGCLCVASTTSVRAFNFDGGDEEPAEVWAQQNSGRGGRGGRGRGGRGGFKKRLDAHETQERTKNMFELRPEMRDLQEKNGGKRIGAKQWHSMLQTLPQQQNMDMRERMESKPKTVVLEMETDDEVQLGNSALAPSVSGKKLFTQGRVTRESAFVRDQRKVVVVGGAESIKRIWYQYKIRPNVVFVPETDETPSWCFNEELPTYLVRSNPISINRQLLSAELNDGFAAEFPMPVTATPPLSLLLDTKSTSSTAAAPRSAESQVFEPCVDIKSALVLHKMAMVSNIGTAVKTANTMGYDAVILDRCTDLFNEKVIRASGGTVLDPNGPKLFRITEGNKDVSPATFLQSVAHLHNLLPLFTMPERNAEPVFPVAMRFHHNNLRRKAAGMKPVGSMMCIGSERLGCKELLEGWAETDFPMKAVSLQMDNAMIPSINAAVAASITMQHFRPNAAKEFQQLVERGVQPNVNEEDTPLDMHQICE